MSSQPNPRSQAAPEDDTAAGPSRSIASAASADDDTCNKQQNSSADDSGVAAMPNKEGSVESNDANDLPPTMQANGAQSDSGSATSPESQSEDEISKPKTRSHFTRSKNTNNQQNGEKESHREEVRAKNWDVVC